MGIDFSGLIRDLRTSVASMQGDTTKIDTNPEMKSYVSGWDAIKAKAEKQNESVKGKQLSDTAEVDIDQLEAEMKSELTQCLGGKFSTSFAANKTKPAFSEEEISLEKLMELCDADVDINKLREANKIPVSDDTKKNAIDTLTKKNGSFEGFSTELLDIIMDNPETAGAINYMVKDVKSGNAARIIREVTKRYGNYQMDKGSMPKTSLANTLKTPEDFENFIRENHKLFYAK